MTYTPILPRIARGIWRCLTQPDHPEPPPTTDQFEQYVDYLVHVEPDGTKTELLRVHVDIDNDHKLCGTWPMAELHLAEIRDDCA